MIPSPPHPGLPRKNVSCPAQKQKNAAPCIPGRDPWCRALLLWSLSLASVVLLAWIDSNILLQPDNKQSILMFNNTSIPMYDKDNGYVLSREDMEKAKSDNPGLPLFCYYLPSLLYGLSGGAFAVFVLTFSYLGDLAAREPSTRLKRFTATETSLSFGTVTGRCLIILTGY